MDDITRFIALVPTSSSQDPRNYKIFLNPFFYLQDRVFGMAVFVCVRVDLPF